MRPVNLIPSEERRGQRSKARTGPVMYLVVGALGVLLLAVTSVVMTGNTISDRQAEIARLTALEQEARTQSTVLQAYADFKNLQEARLATVTNLARSRFDWERVMRELSLVLPDNIWLTELGGTVSPTVAIDGVSNNDLRAQITGPALQLTGCGRSHEAVAGFIGRLRNIDGVTRVMVSKSDRPDGGKAGGSGGGADKDSDCRTRDSVTKFEAIAGFDGVMSAAPDGAAGAPASGAPGAAGASAGQQSVADATDKTKQATKALPGS